MKKTFTFKQIFSAMLLLAAMAIGNSALAQTFDIEATYNSNTHKTLFTITRSGSSLPQQTIKYRTVNLSAYAGIHYTAVSDTYTFPENITTLQVEVSEFDQYTTSYAYHYQTGTTRSYRFEVLDVNGFELAHNDRNITTGAQFSNTYLNNSVTDLVYFTDGGSIMSGSGNKYLDVSYSSSNWTQVTDAGYSQGVHTVSTNSLYNSNSNLRTILNALSYKMYATVYFTQKEEHDGYQYIQIYTGNAGTYDNVDDPNGGIGTLTNSLYRACFILSYSPSGSVMSDPHYQFFPHRYNYVDKAAEIAANITHYEFDYNNSHLYEQKFINSSYNSSTSGSLVLLPTAENINIRFDAGGGGNDHDEWDFKDLNVRLALVDETYPTPINIAGITVSAGPYVKGNTFYISVPFSEIVNTANYSGYKKLVTSWGDATYDSGDGTNVITFKGTINANAGTTLAITSLQCNFKDLAGTFFQGLGNSGYTDSFDKTFNGVTCTESYTLAATNTEFAGLQSEYVVSNTAIEPHPTVYFYKGKKETANKVQLTENTNYTLSWANNNAAGTGSVTATGTGNYNGSISATYPIRWSTYTVSFHDNGSVGIPATGEMSYQSFEYGVAQNLTANAFSREGFTFAGWNTQPDGSGASYSDGEAVTGLTSEDGGTVDLYAQWTAIPWTGSGDSEEDPYVIMYPSQLDQLASNVNGGNEYNNKFFKLGTDITYSYEGLDENESNYTPIGNGSYIFHGTFDGDNKTISGIRIYTTNDSQGVFKSVGINGTVKNVVLANSIFKGKAYVGGITAWNNGILTNCRIEGSVEILPKNDISLYHGGIVGENLGTVSGCISAAIVVKNGMPNVRYYGGVVGENASTGTVKDCLYTGSIVDANNYYGAIAGKNAGILTNNYYTTEGIWGVGVGIANPSGNDSDGARRARVITLDENIVLVGDQTAYSLSGLTAIGTTALSYNDGNTTSLYSGATQSVTLSYTGTINPGYILGYTYNDGTAHAVVGNTFEMPASDVTVSSTFTDVWGIAGGATGSETHPYIISDTTGLNVLAKCVNGTHGYTANNFYNKHFKLGDDITYSYEGLGENESNYTAIGYNEGGNYRDFRGIFDGDNKTISGIRIYTTSDSQGIFGYVKYGNVKNVVLANSIIAGDSKVGGIIGYSFGGTVTNCRVESSVTINAAKDAAYYHGGIVGYESTGTISGCVSAATISDNGKSICRFYGGIVGFNQGNLKDCLYTGSTVTASLYYGSIAGDNSSGYIFANNYYTTDGIGGVNGSDCDGARRARVITLGDNVAIEGDQTAYDVSGITAIGTTALSYNNGTSTTIYSGATQTITLSDAAPQGCVVTSYSLNGTPLAGNTFTMPDSDVTVSATIGVPYIDADGNEQICTDYTLIESSTGSTVILGAAVTETWYAVSGNVNITVSDDQAIKTYGAVHLILMDGATLTVEGQFSIFTFGSLSIYGQSLGTGSLVASSDGTAIYVGESLSNPVVNDGGLTINGGIITTISSNSHNIYAYDITINGGSVSADGGGINANGALTLGWRNATDRIYASSYYGDNGVAVKSGQYLSDGTAVYSGSLSDTQIDALAGKTLQPAVALTLPKYVDATSGVLVQEGRTACVLPDANVTIAAEGYTLTNVTVGGEAATDNGDGTWSFIMPATNATVSATVTAIDFTTGHAGTEADPYIIMYRSQLDLLATRVNGGESYDGKFLKLGADIAYDPNDLDDNGENYTAIGTKVNYRYFKGSFDGDGHIVSGIRINKTGTTDADKYQGLFGYVFNAFIKNVVLSDAHITGKDSVGGILGDYTSTSNIIQNCLVLNSQITSTGDYQKGAICGKYFTTSITLIDNYYYNCTVNGASTNVGANGSDRDGARGVNKLTLCEHVIATPAAAVTYQGDGYYVPGTSVTLSVEEGYTLNDSYSVKDANNNDVALTGGDTFEMPASDVTVSADITVTTMAGSGTEDDPWIIMYRSQMDQLAISEINNGEYYQLGRDLTYSYEGLSETESNYTPIRVNEGGHFDGAGHTISGIRIYPYDDFYDVNKGLFSLNYGTVKNVTLTDAIITGEDYVGGIVGSNTKNGLIDSCHVTSTVIIKAYGYSSDYHGGISGDNAGDVGKIPSIRNCTSAAILTNNVYENCSAYGGIVGENVGGIVSGCTAYGASVTAIGAAGGIVGYNYRCCDYEDPVVENCFAIDCTINSGSAGAIISNSGYATLNHNYYYNCTANDNTTDIGYKDGDITEDDGAVQVFSLTLGEHITATATAAYSYSGNNYYTEGTSVTLSPEEGYAISGSYTVKDADDNDVALTGGNTFEMPASDVTVSATTTELIAFKLYNEDYLVEGDYLIVCKESGDAMSNHIENNLFEGSLVTIENDVIKTSNSSIIWHIAQYEYDYWTIYNAEAGKYAAATSQGYASLKSDGTSLDALWGTIDCTDCDNPEIFNVNNNSENTGSNAYLKFQHHAPEGFACYDRYYNLGHQPLLYRKVETFTKDISGYNDDESGWYLIASPLYNDVNVNNVEHMQDPTFDLYRFNQEAAAEWENWKAEGTNHYHFDLESGRGYLYANSGDITLTFTGWPYSGDGVVNLTKTEGVSFEGWNLIGNPFSTAATLDDNRPFYRMNALGTEIIAATDNTVNPMEGIFVHTDSDYEEMTFTPNFSNAKDNHGNDASLVINLSKGNRGSAIDRAIVRFDSKNTMTKLQIFDGNTKLYIPQDGTDYAIAYSNRQGEIPLNFKAKETGTYTISFEGIDLKNIKLIDILDGKEIDFSETSSYTFIGSPADRQARFIIRFENSENSEIFAYQSGTDIIVTGDGELQIFDVMGRMVLTQHVNGVETIAKPSQTGVYILKLNEKTQKIIMK